MENGITKNLMLLFASVLILFIFLETAVNIFVDIPRFHKRLNDIWWIGIPHNQGTYKTSEFSADYEFNSLGFRDYDYNPEKNPDTCRIAVLGDSFTESLEVGLNQSWPKLLEKRLNNMPNMKFEVINFGLSGAGTSTEYFVMREYVSDFKPDATILLFFTLNDINDNYFRNQPKT